MPSQRLVLVGTYTEPIRFGTGKILEGKGKGIYALRLDMSSGALEQCNLTEKVRNPSYLAVDAAHRYLYAVNELKEFAGAVSGGVSSFALDATTGVLTFLNSKPTHGTDPCHLTVDQSGRNVLVANFMSGSVCVLPIQSDGTLGDASDFIQHQGSSVDPVRQAGPHAHAVTMDRGGRFAFVPDLGIDTLTVYRLDTERGKLTPSDQPWPRVAGGAGPRQVALHPNGQYVYLINELNSTMTAYRFDSATGGLEEFQTLPTLPEGFSGASTCAEVQIAPSGRFLYGSNRGHDSIAIYAVDQASGMLRLIGHQSTGGKTPRHFAIEPSGEFLLAANQDSDTINVFRIDAASGMLSATGHTIQVPTPVCVLPL